MQFSKPFKWLLRHIDGILFDAADERRLQRLFYGALFGLMLARLFWSNVLINLGLPTRYAAYLYVALFTGLTFGYPLVRCVRSCSLLICISFVGRAGRGYMKALILVLVITGPLHNLMLNGREVVRVFTCSARLTYNLTRTRFELMTAPFRRSLRSMPANVTQINRAFERIGYVVRPLRAEIEEERRTSAAPAFVNRSRTSRRQTAAASAQRIEQVYSAKIRRRCYAQIERGQSRCEQAFSSAYNRCRGRLPPIVGPILCAPMRVTVVCSLGVRWAQGRVREVCEPSGTGIVGGDLGRSYTELNGLLGTIRPVRLNMTYVRSSAWHAIVAQTERTRGRIFGDFEHRWRVVRWYMYVMRKVLALFFVKVVYNALCYHRGYLADITHDNVYATNYFRHIDQRRRRQGLVTVWPPRKIERSTLRQWTSGQRTSKEFWSMLVNVCTVSVELLVSVSFVLLDRLVTAGLRLVRRHGRIDYVQRGEHVLDVRVNGTGMVAQLMRKSVMTFNMHVHVLSYADNEVCLPRAHVIAPWRSAAIYALYALVLVLAYAETWIQRMRHCVMAYFYWERERVRVLYLYNECLKKRRGLMRQLRRGVVERLRTGSYVEPGGCCRRQLCCWWMRWWPGCRRKCVVCREAERLWHRDSESMAVECAVCWAYFCAECWHDLEGVCLVCSVREERLAGGGDSTDDDGWDGGETTSDDDSD